uniref:NADH-ubiquinone oxidoreductase chain 4L n=3 Tax=Neotrypaea TaxID=177237 RepID=A0A1S7J207_9EUCA|nr:NADH dehydrogenase subunit 4L [Neotrypaea thermophila]YP_007475332.1 NADH dehydrogenase subunit 4L [Neotrypaea japonica]YP_009353726.1 NADH dehydrogenase subunit 4L [Neotrypaea harmandi]AEW68332.1 NADH dehydrogenase subunit 4L [Neotrypaea thermophila]AGE00864.1 NADH dehydrogenase subunit 4L [Neotrypaea japonica]URF19378.1 NADH dehydrogenase subunit 4L [Neotrypaea japonica]URF19391.1 NADH dehydrogenase subunit 4L [Neotrypaea japonica]URF19404.1 NADH dehydrogenase subunit 4L [Neotrypaea jap
MLKISLLFLIFPLFSILCGLIAFSATHKHLLNTLLSLEFVMLSIFWLLTLLFSEISYEIYLVLFFLTLVACEGALGLALMVSIVRTHGNDYFNIFNSLQC